MSGDAKSANPDSNPNHDPDPEPEPNPNPNPNPKEMLSLRLINTDMYFMDDEVEHESAIMCYNVL